jgi:hypothetical protein
MLHVAEDVSFSMYGINSGSRRKMGNCKWMSVFLNDAIFLSGLFAIFVQFHRELKET